jgi:hypothetical protein
MFKMLSHEVNEIGCTSVRAGGWHDHVHVVCGLSRTIDIADLVQGIKVETSKWAKDAKGGTTDFAWQTGYGVFSVSHSLLPKVVDYVDNQKTHHRIRTFKDEFRELCSKHEIEIDERFVWD